MKVVVAETKREIVDNFYVRGQVFIIGQEIDYEIEFDGLDKDCILFTAYIDDIAVGAARLYKNKVGRVATLEAYRQKGVATKIMEKIEEYAKENNISKLKLHAQLYVKDFYLKLGYTPVGEIFQEADIDHIEMIKEMD
jgi:predicted GNAT family N-acyltransferase